MDKARHLKSFFLGIALVACRTPRPVAPATVVFVCEHGAAKSVIAAQYFNKLAGERGVGARAIARGADPQPEMSTSAVAGLHADGLPAPREKPRALAASDIRGAGTIIAFDCEQPAMTALRGMDACWNDVPATSEGYAAARDRIRAHVEAILAPMVP